MNMRYRCSGVAKLALSVVVTAACGAQPHLLNEPESARQGDGSVAGDGDVDIGCEACSAEAPGDPVPASADTDAAPPGAPAEGDPDPLPAPHAVPGQPSVDGWIWVGGHLHSSTAGEVSWSRGIRHIMTYAAGDDISFQIITDHNTIEGWFKDAFASVDRSVPIRAEEWTSGAGHATLIDFSASSAADVILPCDHDLVATCTDARAEYRSMINTVHSRGGLVVINHPVLLTSAWDADSSGADGAEVGSTATDPNAGLAIAWWVAELEAYLTQELLGEVPDRKLLVAWGGSDYHYLRPPPSPNEDSPINLVHAPTSDIEGVRAAISARHNQVVFNVGGPRVFIGVDTNGDQLFDDYEAGDRIETPIAAPFAIQCRVVGGNGQVLRLYETRLWLEQGAIHKHEELIEVLVTADDFVYALARFRTADTRSLLRGELGSTAIVGRPRNITNPIFF